MLAVIALTVFLVVMLLTGALIYPVLNRRVTVRNRVDRLITPEDAPRPGLLHTKSRWETFLEELGSKINLKSADLTRYRELITSGGFRNDKVNVLMGGKLLLTFLFPALYILLYAIPQKELFSGNTLTASICFAACGYLIPTLWLDYRVKRRKLDILHTLPDVLDLLTVCVESGQSLDAALIKTVDNFHNKKNPLINEIDRVIMEIRAGRVRSEALNGLASRSMVDDVRSFVAMLHQTDKFGTSLGKTLRTYSTTQRTRRRQLAEEQASKTATKMLIPLVVFIFPGLLVIILTPAFLNLKALLK
jgi:tight adherence protein C